MMADNQAYTIRRISPDAVPTDGGRLADGYRVDARTARGVDFYVRVPKSPSVNDDIHEALADEAAKLDEAHARPVPPSTIPTP